MIRRVPAREEQHRKKKKKYLELDCILAHYADYILLVSPSLTVVSLAILVSGPQFRQARKQPLAGSGPLQHCKSIGRRSRHEGDGKFRTALPKRHFLSRVTVVYFECVI